MFTSADLWNYLMIDGREATYEEYTDALDGDVPAMAREYFTHLKTVDLRVILVGQYIGAERLGGDVVVAVVDDVLAAVRDGYRIETWYGPHCECLVVGYDPGQVAVAVAD